MPRRNSELEYGQVRRREMLQIQNFTSRRQRYTFEMSESHTQRPTVQFVSGDDCEGVDGYIKDDSSSQLANSNDQCFMQKAPTEEHIDSEPSEELECTEEDQRVEPYGPATSDVLPVSCKKTQLTVAGASTTEGLEKRRTGAKDAVKTVLLVLLPSILLSGVSSSEIHDLRIYGDRKLFEGQELRLFCAGCELPGCNWYRDGYEEENRITDGISYNTYGSELLIRNISRKHAYICLKNVDKATDIDRVTVEVLPRLLDLKIFGPTRVMVGEGLKLVCLTGTEAYLGISINGTEIHNGEKYTLELIGGFGKMELRLSVPNVSMDDGGMYECIQDNKLALLDIEIIPDLASPPEEKSNAKCGFSATSAILLVVCVMLAIASICFCVYLYRWHRAGNQSRLI